MMASRSQHCFFAECSSNLNPTLLTISALHLESLARRCIAMEDRENQVLPLPESDLVLSVLRVKKSETDFCFQPLSSTLYISNQK
jgi:hypothetical protein